MVWNNVSRVRGIFYLVYLNSLIAVFSICLHTISELIRELLTKTYNFWFEGDQNSSERLDFTLSDLPGKTSCPE